MQTIRRYRSIWLPPVAVLAVLLVAWLCRPFLDWLMGLYRCPIHAVTGLLCPGCGGTRSFRALLQGRLMLSVHENPVPLLLAAAAVLRYIEGILKAVGKPRELLPRKLRFWCVLIGMVLVWAVLRNVIPALMPLT